MIDQRGINPLVAEVSGQGPAVVLLHGQPGTSADWAAVVPLLAGRFTVVAPDRPGYGRTGGPAGGFDANAGAVAELLDRRGIERAVVVGHSWAGAVAIRLAARSPRRVAGLVLVASVGPEQRITTLDRLLASHPVSDLATAAGTGTSRLVAAPRVWRRLEQRLSQSARDSLGALVRRGTPSAAWRSFAVEQREFVAGIAGVAADLSVIACPVDVVVGEADHVVSLDEGERLAASLPGARLVRVPHAGHLLPHDAPVAVASAIADVAARAGLTS